MGKMRVLFVCNRGGHFSQMMALKPLFSEFDSMLVTEKTNISSNVDLGIPTLYIKSARTRKTQLFYVILNFFQCVKICFSFKPAVIVSTGANLAFVMFLAGKLVGAKLVFIESRAKVYTKSTAGKLVTNLSDKIVVQWPELLKVYKNAVYWGQLI